MVTVFTSVYSAKAYSPLEEREGKGTNKCSMLMCTSLREEISTQVHFSH